MAKLLVLGGSGLIGSEVVKDLARTDVFGEVLIADGDLKKTNDLVKSLKDNRFSALEINVEKREDIIELMKQFSLVCNCLPFKYDTYITECCYEAKVTGIDLGATKDQLEMHEKFIEDGLSFVVCCGITPGTSNAIAGYVAERCDSVEEVHVSFASYRALSTSPGLVHTTLWEIDPGEEGRMYYENGEYIKVPPFAGAKLIDFPEPIGTQETYHVPHNEVYTIPRSIPDVKKVSVRGTWTPKTKRFLRFLYDYGFFTTQPIEIDNVKIKPMDFIEKFIFQNEDLTKDDLWGFNLVVDIKTKKDGKSLDLSFYTSHPVADKWGGIPAVYIKSTALSMSVGVHLLAKGIKKHGILTPDQAFDTSVFIKELENRGLIIHERSGYFGFPK